MNVLALCAGIGGLELGIKQAVPSATVVCYVEREAYAAAVVVERMATLGMAPVWSDLSTFCGFPWRGVVDCIAAGYPCQPFSVAGDRRGVEDERWIWPEIARVICEVEPRCVFLENVPAHLGSGFDRVLGDLAALGFDAEWDCIPAAAVGAPHLRDRLFIFAHAVGGELRDESVTERWSGGAAELGDPGAPVPSAHSDGRGLEQQRLGRVQEHPTKERNVDDRPDRAGGGLLIADSDGARLEERLGYDEVETSTERPPGNALCEGLSGFARHSIEGRAVVASGPWADRPVPQPAVRRVDDGLPNRVDRLRALGNGVVPQAAALAWRHLAGRAVR